MGVSTEKYSLGDVALTHRHENGAPINKGCAENKLQYLISRGLFLIGINHVEPYL
jgi:hypothetical protein